MPFQPGNKEAKKKGKHERSKQWELLGESILTNQTERVNEILTQADDKVFINLYLELLKYFKPQLQRTELKNDGDNKLIIEIIRGDHNSTPTT